MMLPYYQMFGSWAYYNSHDPAAYRGWAEWYKAAAEGLW